MIKKQSKARFKQNFFRFSIVFFLIMSVLSCKKAQKITPRSTPDIQVKFGSTISVQLQPGQSVLVEVSGSSSPGNCVITTNSNCLTITQLFNTKNVFTCYFQAQAGESFCKEDVTVTLEGGAALTTLFATLANPSATVSFTTAPKYGVAFGDYPDYSPTVLQEVPSIAKANHIELIRLYDQFGDNPAGSPSAKWTNFMSAAQTNNIALIVGISNAALDNGLLATTQSAQTFVTNFILPFKNSIINIAVGNEVNGPSGALTSISSLSTYINNLNSVLNASGLNIGISLVLGGNDIGGSGTYYSSPCGYMGINKDLGPALQTLSGLMNKQLFINIYPFYAPLSAVTLSYQNIFSNFRNSYDCFLGGITNNNLGAFNNNNVSIGEIGWPSDPQNPPPTAGGFQNINGSAGYTNANLNCIMSGNEQSSNPPPSILFFEFFDEPGKPGFNFEPYFGLFDSPPSMSSVPKTGVTLNFGNPSSATCTNGP